MNDLMHHFKGRRPSAIVYQVVHGTEGLWFDYITNRHEIAVTALLSNSFDDMHVLCTVPCTELV